MATANAGLVAKPTSSGIPAWTQRERSSIQDCGKYNERSISACPRGAA